MDIRLLRSIPLMLLLLSGCFSPAYTPPTLHQPVPATYSQMGDWKPANPQDTLQRGSWWTAFGDPSLNTLIEDLHRANQQIAVAAANFRQARAQAGAARASFFPTVSVPGTASRGDSGSGLVQNTYSVGISTQWEASIWNTIPAYEAAKAQAESSAASYAAMVLAMEAELAQDYFQLRALDGQIALYETTIEAYAKAVQLTRSQYQGGLVTAADVAQAETQQASAEAQLADLQRQRANLQNAVAILTGQVPSAFTLPPATLTAFMPSIPISLPSALLERRPDIASAERNVAAANEQIGLSRAAWFPSLSLGGERSLKAVGFSSAPVTVWSIGPSAALSLFEGGKHLAEGDAAWAGYEAAVARYRQTVLEAFKEVEDNLAALNYMKVQAEAQDRAVASSQLALRLSLSQYRGGLITYLQVVSTQTAALSNERSAIQIQAQRLAAAVDLIKALGGGWDQDALQALQQNPPQEGAL